MIMELRDIIKRVLKENINKTNYEKEVKILNKLLDSKYYEGVCGFTFTQDEDEEGNSRVGSVLIIFSDEWYRSSDITIDLNKKFNYMIETKVDVGREIEKFLGLKDIYVGSYLENCN